MSATIAVGISELPDSASAFAEAAERARDGLGDLPCDLSVAFASAQHLLEADVLADAITTTLSPQAAIGCGASGVLGEGVEVEGGPAAVVWAASLPGARIHTHHITAHDDLGEIVIDGLPEPGELGGSMIALVDPSSFPADALLDELNAQAPGMPVMGGLVSAAGGQGSVLIQDGVVHGGGAVACTIIGASIVPCVSQGAFPVGPEMTITAAQDSIVKELAGVPAIVRLRAAIDELSPEERELAGGGLMLGLVIDANRPEYQRGDFLVRPIVGADPEHGWIAIGEGVRVGQTVRLHVRDEVSAHEDLAGALEAQASAHRSGGIAGVLVFTCNGRGSHMFGAPGHDATTIERTLGVPAAGFFCAGEIGPVGGRNFLHGFTATVAVFGA